MDPDLLQIKIAEESRNWDVMVDKIEMYLIKMREKKIQKREREQEKLIEREADRQIERSSSISKKQSQGDGVAAPEIADDQSKPLKFKYEDIKDIEDEQGQKPKEVYEKNDNQDDDQQKKYQDSLDQKAKYAVEVFNMEERELIACAFKNQLGEIRKALKDLQILQTKSKFDTKKTIIDQYKAGLRKDLLNKGLRQVQIIEDHCIRITGSPIPLIFFKKLQADIYRYLADHSMTKERQEHKDKASDLYNEAIWIQKEYVNLLIQNEQPEKIDSLRLGLYLNYAVFLYEIEQDQKEALRLLKKEIQEALQDFEKWEEEDIEKIKMQVELIQENINIWKKAVDTESEEDN